MAVISNKTNGYFNLPLSIQRLNPKPLDESFLWNNIDDAGNYAKTGKTSYVGQILSVVTKTAETCSSELYIINDEAGTLRRVSSFSYDSSGNIVFDKDIITKGKVKSSGIVLYNSGNAENTLYTDSDGTLIISGKTSISGELNALRGFNLGAGSGKILYSSVDSNGIASIVFGGDISLNKGYGIKYDGSYIISATNTSITISAPNKILNLGDDNTQKINLSSPLFNANGDKELLSKYGDAYFPNSFRASNSLGDDLIATYKNGTEYGVALYKNLRLGGLTGPKFSTSGNGVLYADRFVDGSKKADINGFMKYIYSTSLYKPLDRDSYSLQLHTDADFIVFDNPIEAKTALGIVNSKTRLLDGELFFSEGVYLEALSDGIKHYGNVYLSGNIGSFSFSSGFAGSGWGIRTDKLTGNTAATFDELTVRKKMRVYELEVQKDTATAGALWVTDSCSGDIVEEIS